MDNTELHYLTYDPEAIWTEMQNAYVAAGGEVLWPGDEKEMLLRSVQAVMVQAFAGMDNALRMSTLRYAVGDYLDLIGENRDCARIEATKATATVTIALKASESGGTLAAGTSMTADGEVFYNLTEDINKTAYAQTVTATIECDKTGALGNGLTVGMEMQLAVGDADVGVITVTTAAGGGNDEEDDDTYRERIRQHGLANVTTGPSSRYEAVAMDVSSDIIDAHAVNARAGVVGIWLILAEGASEDNIKSAVAEALNSTDMRPLTDQVIVNIAGPLSYTLNVQYTQETGSNITSAVQQAVADYQEWQDNVVGQAFNPDKLMAMLYQAGCTRVIWGSGSNFNGNTTIAYRTISETQRCKGTITTAVMGNV